MERLEINAVYQSNDYDRFEQSKYQPWNRGKTTHELVHSITATKGNSISPIIVEQDATGRLTVIDGHRRLQACREARVPTTFLVADLSEIGAKDLMIALNKTSKTWTVENYIASHKNDENERIAEDYRALERYMIENKYAYQLIHHFGPYGSNAYKAGQELNIDYDKLDGRIRLHNQIRGEYSTGELSKDILVTTLRELFKVGMDVSRMSERFTSYTNAGNRGFMHSGTEAALKEFSKIYDYRVQDKKYLAHAVEMGKS